MGRRPVLWVASLSISGSLDGGPENFSMLPPALCPGRLRSFDVEWIATGVVGNLSTACGEMVMAVFSRQSTHLHYCGRWWIEFSSLFVGWAFACIRSESRLHSHARGSLHINRCQCGKFCLLWRTAESDIQLAIHFVRVFSFLLSFVRSPAFTFKVRVRGTHPLAVTATAPRSARSVQR